MNPKFRLRKSTDFERVRRHGKSYAHPLIVLIALRNNLDRTRIGVAAGKSLGKAVNRNRAKRVIRAAVNPTLQSIEPGWDLVFLARKPLINAAFATIRSAILELLSRANLVKNYHVL
ncbi:MAG: ribonuclease P protein component [Anaerolineales bacterium]